MSRISRQQAYRLTPLHYLQHGFPVNTLPLSIKHISSLTHHSIRKFQISDSSTLPFQIADSLTISDSRSQTHHFSNTRSQTHQFSDSRSQRMGNITSCYSAKSSTAKLIDLRRNTLRVVEAPVTAAELMLEEPGCAVAPLADCRRGSRISAMKADDSLSGGGVYLLVALSRINGKVSESEMAVIKSMCGERRAKRRSSKVIPIATESAGDGAGNPVKVFGEGSDIGRPNYRIRQWKPALEPIREGI